MDVYRFFFLIIQIILATYCFAIDSNTQSIPPSNSVDVKIISYNVRICKGMDNVIDYERVSSLLNEYAPDFVALQELDSATNRSNGKVTGQEIADRLGLFFEYSAAINYDNGTYGVGLLSKEKPLAKKTFSLPGKDENRTLLLVEFPKCYVCVTHISLCDTEKKESSELICKLLKAYADKPLFLCGDFNETPDGNSQSISLLTHELIQLSDRNIPTFPSNNPEKVIDYIFGYPKSVDFDIIFSCVIQDSLASDHRPVYVNVRF